ncbi:MAG: TPM domain-containing protein [Bacilli bacterium]|nr:TPM domain-containing protein [Bacilli bacterium]
MKKLKLLLLILSLILIPNVFASTQTQNRGDFDNLGVNKHWKITDKNRINVMKTDKVNADEKIYDFSDILTDEEEKRVYDRFMDFIRKTKMDMVFVSINMPYVNDSDIETFAADFYDYNDFGLNFKNYSGVLIVRNTYEQDPFYNIYLFGEAQLYFYGDRTENTLDRIYNSFHSGRYEEGLNTFIDDFNSYYDRGIDSSLKNKFIDEDGYIREKVVMPWLAIVGADLLVIFIVLLILIHKNKMVTKKLNVSEYFDKSSLDFTKKNDIFLREHTTHYTVSSSSGSGGGHSGGGFHSSGGSSGGGHSSGGGRHG